MMRMSEIAIGGGIAKAGRRCGRKIDGGVVKLRCFDLGVTQKNLSESVGIDPVYLSQLVNGKHAASEKLIVKIANALNVEAFVLVKDGLSLSKKPETVEEVLDTLPNREREIVKMRYGCGKHEPHTLKSIGEAFGLTKERTRQILFNIENKLGRGMRARWLKEILS